MNRRGKSRVEQAPGGGWLIHHWYGTDHSYDWPTAIESANIYAHLSRGRFDVR